MILRVSFINHNARELNLTFIAKNIKAFVTLAPLLVVFQEWLCWLKKGIFCYFCVKSGDFFRYFLNIHFVSVLQFRIESIAQTLSAQQKPPRMAWSKWWVCILEKQRSRQAWTNELGCMKVSTFSSLKFWRWFKLKLVQVVLIENMWCVSGYKV